MPAEAAAPRSGSLPGRRDLIDVAALAGVLLLALVLRVHGLGQPSFWGDEIASVELARKPLAVLWSDWMVHETNPPLYYSLLHVWMRWFGESEAAVRSLSIPFGIALVYLVYRVGLLVKSHTAGLLAALFCAVWADQIYFSQEARAYIIGAAGAVVCAIAVLELADRLTGGSQAGADDRLAGRLALYFVGALAAVYSHTTLVVLPAVCTLYLGWVWLFRSGRPARPALAWIAVHLLLVLAWSWWGWITWRQMTLATSNVSWIPKPSLYGAVNVATLLYSPAGATEDHTALRYAMQLGGGALVIALAGWGLTRMTLERAVFLAAFALGAPLTMYLLSQHTPVLIYRTLFWTQFSVIVALGVAVAQIRPILLRAAAVGGLVCLLLVGRTVQTPKEPWRELVRELSHRLGPGDALVVSGPGIFIQHYCDRIGCRFRVIDAIGDTEQFNRWKEGMFRGPRPTRAALAQVLSGARNIWAISVWEEDPRPLLQPMFRPGPPVRLQTSLPAGFSFSTWRPATAVSPNAL